MPRTNWLGWGVGIVCVATIYHAVVSRLVFVEWRREDFDYCYLIPVIVAYLIWERKVELSSMPSRSSWAGLAAAFGAAVFLVLGELGGEFLALFLSLACGVCLLLGTAWVAKTQTHSISACFLHNGISSSQLHL